MYRFASTLITNSKLNHHDLLFGVFVLCFPCSCFFFFSCGKAGGGCLQVICPVHNFRTKVRGGNWVDTAREQGRLRYITISRIDLNRRLSSSSKPTLSPQNNWWKFIPLFNLIMIIYKHDCFCSFCFQLNKTDASHLWTQFTTRIIVSHLLNAVCCTSLSMKQPESTLPHTWKFLGLNIIM